MTPISILIPTRGRPGNLKASIDASLQLAAHPERVEIMLGADLDDAFLEDIRNLAEAYAPNTRIEVFRERYGYEGLYVYFNRLAELSKGAWLLNWNDDTEFVTQGWDTLLCEAPPVAVQFFRRDVLESADPTFMATSRNIYEAMGHLSLNAHCDAWISDVSHWAGCQVIRNDIVFRHHCLADKTARERCDDMPRFKGPLQTALRKIDIGKVKALVEKASISSPG